MDPAMTVEEPLAVSVKVKQVLFESFPNVGDVMVHITPRKEEHEELIRLLVYIAVESID
jgi:divalent metal cation (Fe/Co/Zn/Cd) transporter